MDYINKENQINDNKGVLLPALRYTENGNFYGYINLKGDFIISPQFKRADEFNSKGIAIVEKDGFVGGINSQGQYVIEPVYSSISQFVDGRAIFVLDNFMGVMDDSGKVLTNKKYTFINNYSNERAVFGLMENNNDRYLYGYLDNNGNEVIEAKYEEAFQFKDDIALVKQKNTYMLIDKKGKVLFQYNYPYVNSYGEEKLVFAKEDGGPYGYINKEGTIVIEPIYTSASEFKNGVAIVGMGPIYSENFGVISEKGHYIYEPIYDDIINLGEDRIALGKFSSDEKIPFSFKYAIGDTAGKLLTEYLFLSIGEYEEGLSYGSNEEFTFFINKEGEIDNTFPIVRGSGSLKIRDNIIYADINFSPFYLKANGDLIYRPNIIIDINKKYKVIRGKYKPNFNYLIYYPIVDGIENILVRRAINTRLKLMSLFNPNTDEKKSITISADQILDYNYYGDFSILYYKNNIICFDILGYYYPFGAAHGLPYRKTPLVNLRTGQIYKLEDLFVKGSNWENIINGIIKEMISTDKQYEVLFTNSFEGIKSNQSFYLQDENLVIYYPPYEIAPYAAGFVTFKIPIEKIKDIYKLELM